MSKLWAVLAAGAAMVASVPAQALQLYTIKVQLTSVYDQIFQVTMPINETFEAVLGYDENSNKVYFHSRSSLPGLAVDATREFNVGTGENILNGSQLNLQAFGFQSIGIDTTLNLLSPPPAGLGSLSFSTSQISVFQRVKYYSGTITSAAITAVPEPSTWLMMMTGIGVAGAGLRRRPRPARLTGSLT